MRASPTRPFDSRVGRTRARGLLPHPGSAAGHLSGGLSPALATRLDPHDPVAELALHFPVQLNLGRVGPTTVTAVPISNDDLHECSLSRRSPATGASREPEQAGRNRRRNRKKRVYHAPPPRFGRTSLDRAKQYLLDSEAVSPGFERRKPR